MSLTEKISDAITGGRSHAFLSDGTWDVLFDSVRNFTENDSYTVSDHAIETGSDISDHVLSNPKIINFSAVITDDDFSLTDVSGFSDPTIEDRFDILDLWQDDKPLLTYYGHDKDYENLILTDVTRNKDLDVSNGWGVDISLKVVSVVSSSTSALAGGGGDTPTQKGKTAKGKDTKPGTTASSKNQSILKGLL